MEPSRAGAQARALSLSTILLQKCHLRHWHLNDRAGSANLGEKQITMPMRFWPNEVLVSMLARYAGRTCE